ncbi:MAG TPA: hypothetical protein VFA38_04470 [Nitrospirales bacterium]|nr:hypothetical protein [Nitrospirales bacterium]
MRITLPATRRRAELRGFALSLSAITLAVLIPIFGVSAMLLPTILLAAGTSAALAFPQIISLPYRAWNKCTRGYAQFSATYLMALCFHLVFRFVALAGRAPSFAVPRPTASLWMPRTEDVEQRDAVWVSSFLSWAWRTSNVWAICLLPLLIVLPDIERSETSAPSSDLYTLF